MKYIIKSKRFILRPYGKGDEKDIVDYANDRAVSRYMINIPYPYKIKDAKKWIRKCIKESKRKKKRFVSFALEFDGKLIGGIGLDPIIEDHKAEIGYALGKKYWNKGLMTEALKLVTDFGFKEFRLKRITAHVITKNKASAKVLKKNGYKLEGTLRKHNLKDGRFYDAWIYAKVK
jgi:RimJ/RimL family protein N-acetyltransferase